MRLVLTFLIAASFSLASFAADLNASLAFLKKAAPYDFPETSTIDSLHNANRIAVLNGNLTDDDFVYLAPLCQLSNIEVLDFRFNQLTGAGLGLIAAHCGNWNTVTYIDLGGNPLVDANLVHLNTFESLEAVNLDYHDHDTPSLVTGAFLKDIRLTHLENIWAVNTSLSDGNARALLNMPGFESFNFKGSTLSQAFLAELSAVKINLAAKKWDLRRIQYESRQARECMPDDDQETQNALLELARNQGLFDTDAIDFAKANGLLPMIVPDQEGSHTLYWICKLKGHDEL